MHLQTFLALEWVNLFDIRFADWRANLSVPEYWTRIDTIPDHQFWSIRQELTAELFADVDKRLRKQHQANGLALSTIDRATRLMHLPAKDVLVLGVARRFATYKRATLIFSERERLAKLLNDPEPSPIGHRREDLIKAATDLLIHCGQNHVLADHVIRNARG